MASPQYVHQLATRVFGSATDADVWLDSYSPDFPSATPRELLDHGGRNGAARVVKHLEGLSTSAAIGRTQALDDQHGLWGTD